MNPEFLIRIIVRARNEIAGVMEKAAGDVDKLTKAQERHSNQGKKFEERQRSIRKEFDEFTESIKRGEKSTDDAVFGLRRLSQEMDKLARSRPIGDPMAESLNQASQAAKRSVAEILETERAKQNAIKQTAREQEKATAREIADRGKLLGTRAAERSEQRLLQTSVEETTARYENFHLEVERGQHSAERARAGYRQFGSEFAALQRKFDAGSEGALNLGVRMEEARGHAQRMETTLRRTGGAADQVHSALGRLFGIDPSKLERIDQRISDFERNLNRGRFSVAAFDNRLRGLLVVGAIAFFQQLVGVAGALAGTLLSVASAASQAALSLGAMATAGAAQALPVIGLLGAAWGRVGAVFKAVQQAQKNQATASYDNAQAADRQRAATEALANAQDGLEQAHRRVADAQEAVSKAREDGVRTIQDLLEAERAAELQAEAAQRAHDEAARSLRRSIASGDVDQQVSDEFSVRNTAFEAGKSTTALGRARIDASQARQQGVEGLDSVQAAVRSLRDAQRGVKQAQQAMADARREASKATTEVSAAQRALDQMLAQLSPAERGLYEVLTRVQRRYKRVFTGPGGVLETIINSFSFGASRIYALLGDQRIISTAHRLADTIAGQMNRAFAFLTNDTNIDFLTKMADEAAINLPIIGDIGQAIFDIFRNIATTASPALHDFLGFIRDIARDAADATGTDSGLAKLSSFFSRGEHFAEGMVKLAIAVGGLFLAIVDDAAGQGSQAIDDLTSKINEATDWINSHEKDVQNFFRQARIATGFIAGAIFDLAKGLFSLFHPDQVKTFSEAWSEVLLPALLDVARVMGAITLFLLQIATSGPGEALARMLLTATLLYKALSPVVSLFARMIVLGGTLASSERLVAAGLTAVEVASGPLGKGLALLVALFLILNGHIHNLGDVLETLLPVLAGMAALFIGRAGLAAGVRGLFAALNSLAAAGLAGRLGGIGTALGAMLTKVLGLVRNLPIVNKLLSNTAKAEVVADVTGRTPGGVILPGGTKNVKVVESAATQATRGAALSAGEGAAATGAGAAAGKLFGGKLSQVALGFIKKAGWLGIGISAGTALLSGFKHNSVRAGFQDFFHSLSFGLIDSVDEAGTKAGNRLAAKLKKAIQDNLPPSRGGGRRQVTLEDLVGGPTTRPATVAPTVGRGAAPGGTRDVLTQAGNDIDALTLKYGKKFRTFLLGFVGYANDLKKRLRSSSSIGMDALYDQVVEFAKTAPPEFKGAMDEMVKQAKQHRDEVDRIFNRKIKVAGIVTDFGLALQGKNAEKNMKAITEGLIRQIADLKPKAREKAADSAIAMARGLESKGLLPKKAADKIEEDVTKAMERMRKRAARKSAQAAIDTATALSALSNVVSVSMGDLIGDVNSVLKSLGFSGIHLPKKITPKQVDKGAGNLGALLGSLGGLIGGSAGGGWLGKKGERGGDVIPRLLGRGEAVLNWGHQKAVEPALAFAKAMGASAYGSLDEVFSKIRGKHGKEAMGGLAGGGYTQGALAPPSGTPAFIRKLFARGFEATSAFRPGAVTNSGVASDHSTGHAWDFGDSVNNLRRLWAVVRPLAGQIKQLFGPTYVSGGYGFNFGKPFNQQGSENQRIHEDHIHIALGGAVRGALRALTNIASAAFAKLAVPRVPGSGPLSHITQGLLDRVARAGNRRLEAAGGDVGGGSFSDFTGTGRGLMQKIARDRGWSFADWWALDASETSHGRNLSNPTSTARLRGQFLNFNWGKFGKGSDPRQHPSMREQIIAMARYISERWGNPTRAWAFHRANNYYDTGGEVPGPQGTAVPIVAHAKEWVVNQVQQSRLARMAGTTIHGLRGALGFHGGPTHYQGGGEPGRDFQLPTIYSTSIKGLAEVAHDAQTFMSALNTRAKGFVGRFRSAFREMIGQGGILDQMDAAIRQLSTNLDTSLVRATYRLTKSGNVVLRLGAVAVADRTTRNLERAYTGLVSERGVINRNLNDVTARIDDLRKGGVSKDERGTLAYLIGFRRKLQDRLDGVRQNIAANLQSTYEAIGQQVQTRVDRVNNRAGRRNAALDIRSRVATALGNVDQVGALAVERIDSINKQVAGLTKARDFAASKGRKDLVQQIEDQIVELQTTVTEIAAQQLNDAIDRVTNAASRRSGQLDLQDRMATVLEKTGDVAGAFRQRGQILQDRGSNILSERNALYGLLNQATAQGNTAAQEKLNDQIAELNVQLAENTQAIAENTTAARQARIDAITNRSGFLTGVFGNLSTLLGAIGGTTGTVDVAGQRGLIQQVISVLQGTGTNLAAQLMEGFGIDLRGLGGVDLVHALSALNFDQIEASFTPDQKSQFEALINAIIDNASAVQSNTEQLNEITNPTSQSFTSTAWQWFRNAIFNGSGGLLPQYVVPPMMDVGGDILSNGLIYAHAGEKVVAANVARGGGGAGDVFAPHIENHEKTVDMDAETMANRLWFNYKNRPK